MQRSLELLGGNMMLQRTAIISSRKNTGADDTGAAGNIAIAVGNIGATPPVGDFTMESGSQILASSPGSAGAIVINVAHTASVDGLVQSRRALSGTSVNQGPGGGSITITAGCSLLVSDTGAISSEGGGSGADLVHLQAWHARESYDYDGHRRHRLPGGSVHADCDGSLRGFLLEGDLPRPVHDSGGGRG